MMSQGLLQPGADVANQALFKTMSSRPEIHPYLEKIAALLLTDQIRPDNQNVCGIHKQSSKQGTKEQMMWPATSAPMSWQVEGLITGLGGFWTGCTQAVSTTMNSAHLNEHALEPCQNLIKLPIYRKVGLPLFADDCVQAIRSAS